MNITSFAIGACCSGVASLLVFWLCARRRGISDGAAELFCLLAVPLGVWCGHLLYSLALVREMVASFGVGFLLAPWRGGFMFYGTVAGVCLAARLAAGRKKEGFRTLMDCAAIALAVLIAGIRFCEPLDGQGRGMPLDGTEPWQFFPIAYAVDPEWPDEMNYALFILEGVWALCTAVIAFIGLRKRPAGKTAILTLVLYATGQILLETLRRDVTVRWRFVRVSQVISAVLLLLLVLWAIRLRRITVKRGVWSIVGVLCLAGIVVAMEFAVDKPLHLPNDGLFYFPYWLTYSIIALCALGIGLISWKSMYPGKGRTA